MMRALRVIIELASPVVVSGPIHLDAIMSYAKLRTTRAARRSVPHGLAWEPTGEWPTLPLFKRHFEKYSWWAASAVIPVGARSSIAWVKQFDRSHIDALDIGRATKVTVTNGIWRDHMITMEIAHCETMEFFCVGYREPVRQLLRRVPGIGKKLSQGFGRVRKVSVETLGADLDSFDLDWRRGDGPARNIPESFAVARGVEGGVTMDAPIAPPYWRSSERAMVPARVPEWFPERSTS